jgi:ABC-type polysaccharide/polyol phosphate transport system ATPase subunit
MTTTPMVSVKGLGKKYKIYENPIHRLYEWLSFGKRVLHKDFWALSDISFEVKRGECFGIIGENGAGKSTILKILTGALSPTHGEVKIQGRSLSILELGAGFNGDLTGRKNVENNAVLLGFPAGYVTQERMRAIEDFADIGEFFDRPVKMYSSGMHVRLAFSMFMMMEPDVFIIDEALSVGDIFFSQKCFAKIHELKEKGVTFIFVSHDLAAAQNLSDSMMILSRGHQAFIGAPEQAVSRYYGLLRKSTPLPAEKVEEKRDLGVAEGSHIMDPAQIIAHSILNGKNRHGQGGLEIVAARVTDKDGTDTLSVPMLGELRFYLLLRATSNIQNTTVGIDLYDKMKNLIFCCASRHLKARLRHLSNGEELTVGFKLRMNVQAGEYTFNLKCGAYTGDEGMNRGTLCDAHESLGPLSVTFDYNKQLAPFYGIALLPMEML